MNPLHIFNLLRYSNASRLLSDKLVGLLKKGQEKVVITISFHFGVHATLDEFMATTGRIAPVKQPLITLWRLSLIYKLYEKADRLENGRLFRTDGSVIQW